MHGAYILFLIMILSSTQEARLIEISLLAICLLKPIHKGDFFLLREIFSESIQALDDTFYTKEQIQAWSAQAWLPGLLDRPLEQGRGWISLEGEQFAAFGIRYPMDRLALLYCHPTFSRRGHATVLLNQIESDALKEGHISLVTEASFLSHPLLLKRGWIVENKESLKIGGVPFDRFKMKKYL